MTYCFYCGTCHQYSPSWLSYQTHDFAGKSEQAECPSCESLQSELREVHASSSSQFLLKQNQELREQRAALTDEVERLKVELREAREELERERMRLAACSTAALGYFDGCHDDYKSASLDDVLKLREQLQREQAARKVLEEAMQWYSKDSINHHNYHALMGVDLVWKARQALAISREILEGKDGGMG